MFVRSARLFSIIVFIAGSLIGTGRDANAKGTVVVTKSDGSRKVYQNVFIRVRGSAMSLASSDGKGKLTIGKADCSPVGHLLRCVADDATLTQHGEALQLLRGTAWLDLSTKPHGLRLTFQTKAGATVSANGTIDQFEK